GDFRMETSLSKPTTVPVQKHPHPSLFPSHILQRRRRRQTMVVHVIDLVALEPPGEGGDIALALGAVGASDLHRPVPPRQQPLPERGAMTQLERSIELIKEMIAQREAGANAKAIEGVAERVPALPPPSRKARRKVRRSDRADSGLAPRVVGTASADGNS